jgi:serine phosphatase RsbU (regulator of sigma subunit)
LQFAETIVDLGRGDTFLLYTDGLFGAPDGHRPRLTPTQLAGMLNPFSPNAEALLSRMLEQAMPTNRANSQPDDVTALAVRRAN